jgi:hypothetical protein
VSNIFSERLSWGRKSEWDGSNDSPSASNIMHAMHQCVQQWWIMPEGNTWSYAPALHTFQVCMAHLDMYACIYAWGLSCGGTGGNCTVLSSRPTLLYMRHLQRIVELQESWRIMVEFNTSGGPGQQYAVLPGSMDGLGKVLRWHV